MASCGAVGLLNWRLTLTLLGWRMGWHTPCSMVHVFLTPWATLSSVSSGWVVFKHQTDFRGFETNKLLACHLNGENV